MSACEATTWLEGELKGFPERAGGEELYRFFVRITGKPLSTDAEDRQALIDALREWLGVRTEPRTMLAVEIAAAHGLSELRHDIELLLSDVKAGKAFLPFYSQTIEKALQRMSVAS